MRQIANIIVHSNFSNVRQFDIALIKLESKLKFGYKIRPICLPDYQFESINSTKARVVGWGYKKFKDGTPSETLQEVDLDIISHEQCTSIYGSIHVNITRRQICTWDSNKDACSVSFTIQTTL